MGEKLAGEVDLNLSEREGLGRGQLFVSSVGKTTSLVKRIERGDREDRCISSGGNVSRHLEVRLGVRFLLEIMRQMVWALIGY